MKTFRGLWPRVVDPENVWAAYRDARKGKRRRSDVAAFMVHEETRVSALQHRLAAGRWKPGGYRTFVISVPKRRLIAAAPFEDRIVHHAVHRVLAPTLLRRFVRDTYACLEGRGTHRAILAFQAGLRRYRWVSRLDVRRYFLEIRWPRLMDVLSRTVNDRRMLGLVWKILESGRGLYADSHVLERLALRGRYQPEPEKGLPIGNLTSQLFANAYLDALDHFVKRTLKVPTYVRYLDDLAIFGNRAGALEAWAEEMRAWCREERGLELRTKGEVVQSTRGRFTYLGCTVDRTHRRPSGATLRRMRARVRCQVRGGVREDDVEAIAEGWASWAKSLAF